MNPHHEIAFRIDPVLWAKVVLEITPHQWQEPFLRAKGGADILCLTSRQFGKTTAAAICLAHTAIFEPGTLSVVACPSQQQSAEAIRKVKAMVLKAGAKLVTDNVYRIELENGSRVLALPASDDTVRGLTVTGWIIADEAARLPADLIGALRPMRARCAKARFVMISTAWSRTDQFWLNWISDDPSWLRIKATIEEHPDVIAADFLDKERRQGDDYFKREYLGIPSGGHVSPFTFELYERATQPVAMPQLFNLLKPTIIAHDVGRSKDHSTAVVGGRSALADPVFASEFTELRPGLCGSMRAEELAAVDRRLGATNLIVPDLSNDPTYAEVLFERFGPRLIGLHITRSGDGMERQIWQVKTGFIPVYTIGRTYLLDFLHRTMSDNQLRILPGPAALQAYEQLMMLEVDLRESGMVYQCPSGHHDDLAISLAMLVWAACHPHLPYWMRALEPRRPPKPEPYGWEAFV